MLRLPFIRDSGSGIKPFDQAFNASLQRNFQAKSLIKVYNSAFDRVLIQDSDSASGHVFKEGSDQPLLKSWVQDLLSPWIQAFSSSLAQAFDSSL